MTGARFDHLLAGLARDPEIFPHQFDLLFDRVLLTRLPIGQQNEASFLDQRVLTPGIEGAWFPWRLFEDAAAEVAPVAPSFLFHVGRCGSTLLSRLLAWAYRAPALRKPLALRVFAADAAQGPACLLAPAERNRRLAIFARVLARGRSGVVVKATSMCGGLVDHVPGPAAFLRLSLETYAATMLGAPASAADLRGFAQARWRRVAARWPNAPALAAMSPGALCALSWLAEAQDMAAASRPVEAFDFDVFLGDPQTELERLAAALGLPPAPDRIAAALAGPVPTRYAKAPEHPFDKRQRADDLARAPRARRRDRGRARLCRSRCAGVVLCGGRAGKVRLSRQVDQMRCRL